MATKYPKVEGLNLNYDSTKYLARGNRYGAGAADGVAIESKFILDNYTGQFLTYALEYLDTKASSGIAAVKTGVSAAAFSPLTAAPEIKSEAAVSTYIGLSVAAKDGSEAKTGFTLTLPSANTIVTTASSYTNLVGVVNKLGTSYTTLNSTVKVINEASGAGSFRQGDKDTLEAAKSYTAERVKELGDVYSVQGSKTVAQLKAITSFTKGNVYNITEAFYIDGKRYPEYTNIVLLNSYTAALAYSTAEATLGFSGAQIDALGGVQDLSNYSQLGDTVKSLSWTAETTGAPISSSSAGKRGTITLNINNGTSTTIPLSFKDAPNAVQRSATAAATGVQVALNNLSLTGFADGAGSSLSKGVSLNTKAPSISVAQTTTGVNVSVKGDGDVFSRTITAGTAGLIPSATSSAFGVVKTGAGINNASGVISIPKNTFDTSKYLTVSYTTNADNGQDFILDIVCNPNSTIDTAIPLQKADSTTLGVLFNPNGTYVKLKSTAASLDIDQTALVTKLNSITAGVTDLEKRVTALETLLSLT